MKQSTLNSHRILALAPSSRGVGFAVMENIATLVDWGVRSIKGDKNAASLARIGELIDLYQPEKVILQDVRAKGSRRSKRIQELGEQIQALTIQRNVKTALYSPRQIRQTFFGEEPGTKHRQAQLLAARFPEELESRLPPKRRAWESEDSRMDIFEAVALVLTAKSRRPSPRRGNQTTKR